jgi:hypothetical protein
MKDKIKTVKQLLQILKNSSACVCTQAIPFIEELVKENAEMKKTLNALHPPKKKLDKCPDCGKYTVRAKGWSEGGGIECINPECGYWFCY